MREINSFHLIKKLKTQRKTNTSDNGNINYKSRYKSVFRARK